MSNIKYLNNWLTINFNAQFQMDAIIEEIIWFSLFTCGVLATPFHFCYTLLFYLNGCYGKISVGCMHLEVNFHTALPMLCIWTLPLFAEIQLQKRTSNRYHSQLIGWFLSSANGSVQIVNVDGIMNFANIMINAVSVTGCVQYPWSSHQLSARLILKKSDVKLISYQSMLFMSAPTFNSTS